MSRSIKEILYHIRDELQFLQEDAVHFNYETFAADRKTVHAYARSFEIIGEASKSIPEYFKLKYPQVDWKGFAGFRDILIHQYFGIDKEIVWRTVIEEVPETLTEIIRIISLEKD
ncbi:MAG: DUF86 domain-containing protein [Chitinophagaceae bacterium]|nr:DUF86 domain-containing protein [Chitinophagaceae bacterium]